jgi:hypothetical protein
LGIGNLIDVVRDQTKVYRSNNKANSQSSQ